MEKQITEFNIKDYFAILVRRKWTILIVLLSVMVPLTMYVKSFPDTYFSKAQIVIDDLKASSSEFTPQAFRSTRSFNFYQGIFKSRSFLQAIVDSVGRYRLQDATKDTSDDKLRFYVGGAISLRLTNYESFVELSSVAKTPKLAYELAVAATQNFKYYCREVVATESDNMVKETEKQIEIIRNKLEEAEKEYRKFSEKVGSSGEGSIAELKNLQNKYYELRSEKTSKEVLYEANRDLLRLLEKRMGPKDIDNKRAGELAKIQRQLIEKEKEKQRLESLGLMLGSLSQINIDINELEKEILKIGNPEQQERVDPKIISQWQKMRKTVVEDEMELDILSNKLNVYDRKIEAYKKSHPNELAQTLELARLERARKVYEDTYNILLEKVEMAKIRRSAETGGVTIIDAPVLPVSPLPKNEGIYYIAGIIIALVIGIGYVILRELLDTTVKSTDDLESKYQIPVIGTIPHLDISKKADLEVKRRSADGTKETVTIYPRELIDFNKDESVIAESFRSLRTNLFFTSPDKPLKTLIVSSSGPHEGKSLTASNLCLACAQSGKKVLLIDADLRRPILHHLFQQPRENGFTDLFLGKSLDEVVRNTGLENFHFITAGRFTPSPAELLGSKKVEALINEFTKKYDLVVFDTPPVMAVTDAPLLSTKVDGVVLIIKSYSTDKGILERAVASLQNVNSRIAGFILNDIDLSHRSASYGYYKYYYHYYRSQKD
jgi:tyrosine-protein kinase Etk/Wzc